MITCQGCGTKVATLTPPLRCSCGAVTWEVTEGVSTKWEFQNGPGSQLRRLFRFLEGPDCGCIEYATRMNSWGRKGCRERLWQIASDLADKASKRPMLRWLPRPLRYIAASAAVWLAIAMAERAYRNQLQAVSPRC